jgi:hypothetical protein
MFGKKIKINWGEFGKVLVPIDVGNLKQFVKSLDWGEAHTNSLI